MKVLIFFVPASLFFHQAAAHHSGKERHRHLTAASAITSPSQLKECPPGYAAAGKSCERVNVSSPSLVCPPGATSTNGQCLIFAPPSTVCPSGTQQAGNVCLFSHATSASYECRAGELDATGRMCQIVTEVPPVCPSGFHQYTPGECSRASASAMICPPGLTLEGSACKEAIVTPAIPTCEEDLTFDGSEACSKLVPVPSNCPLGYQSNGQECIQFHSLVPGPCPPGFLSQGSQCIRRMDLSPTFVCPSSYSLSGNICVQEVPVPPTCPSGALASTTGGCERPVNKVPVCQDGAFMIDELIRGHSQKGSLCGQSRKVEPSVVCPPNYTLMHGKCKKVTLHPTAQRCTQGVLQQGVCALQSPQTPLYECPAGYQLTQGPKCVRNVSYDCSTTVVTQQCQFPAYLSQLMGVRGSYGGTYKASKEAVAAKEEPLCQDVSRSVPKTCLKVETAPVQLVCPDGALPDGQGCPSVNTFEADVFCPRGLLDQSTGQCVEMHVQPAQIVCPPEARLERNVCIQQEVQPASMVCPEGADVGYDGRCSVRVAEVHHANRVLQQPAHLVCDKGRLVHGSCVHTETVPKNFMCPQGTNDVGGGCAKAAPLSSPPPVTVTKAALYVCPDGSSPSGKSCHSTRSIPANRVCHDGGELRADRCIQYAQLLQSAPTLSQAMATPVCPAGQTLQGNACIHRTQEPVSVVCPEGYNMHETGNGVKCAASHPMHEVCPPGSQRTAEGCMSRTFVPPQATTPKHCTKGQAGC